MTVYAMVDMVRRRPPMYLGDYRIHSLQNMIAGMHWAGADDGGNAYRDFTNWYCLVAGARSSCPWTELEDKLGQEAALREFLEHLDRFRACTLVPLEISMGPFSLQWTVTPSPAIPSGLQISRYAPTDVYVLRELGEHGDDLCEEFPSSAFSSASEARGFARSKWAAPQESWRPGDAQHPAQQ
jgi:hypothetical protein